MGHSWMWKVSWSGILVVSLTFYQQQQHGSAEGYKTRGTYDGHRYCFFFPFPFLDDFSFEQASSTHKDRKIKKEIAKESLILKMEESAAQSRRENKKTFTLRSVWQACGFFLRGVPTATQQVSVLYLKPYIMEHVSFLYIAVNPFEYHRKTHFRQTYEENKIPIRYNWRMSTF